MCPELKAAEVLKRLMQDFGHLPTKADVVMEFVRFANKGEPLNEIAFAEAYAHLVREELLCSLRDHARMTTYRQLVQEEGERKRG